MKLANVKLAATMVTFTVLCIPQVSAEAAGENAVTPQLPTPPPNAKVYSNVDQMTSGWDSCHSPSCAGGSGEGTYWQIFNQSSPSRDGRSMEMFQDGSWSNALWYHKMGPYNSATNFLFDFFALVDSASVNAAQALEYDAFQFVGGYNYMMGTQCNYAAGWWDTWSESTGRWLHTTISCKKFAAGTWHHIQWYITTNHSSHTYTYKTFVLDGVVHNLNQTQHAKYISGWGDNAGVQWQLDDKASGTGYHEWIDKAIFQDMVEDIDPKQESCLGMPRLTIQSRACRRFSCFACG